jgi:nucleoside-diphosphate-sugar epimerase
VQRQQILPQPDLVPPFEDLTCFRGSRIGITGRGGVLGRVIARRFDRSNVPISEYNGDISDAESLDAWLAEAQPDYMFHFAARVSVQDVRSDPLRAFEVNALGTHLLALGVARHTPAAWLFIASSSHVYQPTALGRSTPLSETSALRPPTLYGATKLAGESMARLVLENAGVDHCVGRIFSFTHAEQRPPYLVPSLLAQLDAADNGEAIVVQNPRAVRDIMDAESVVDIILHLAALRSCGVVNIGTGTGITIEALAVKLAASRGKTVVVERAAGGDDTAIVADISVLQRLLAGLP